MAEQPKESFRRSEDFASLYANNIRLEPSVWDLKLIFGLLDLSTPGEVTVEQHSAISMAWSEAKVMTFYLLVHLTAHQADNGPIQVPFPVIPPRPSSSDPTITGGLPARKAVEYMAWIHEQLFGTNPYVPPAVEQLEAATEEKP
jgi:hypothetical protein